MKNTTTGDTLCDSVRPILLENIIVPRSVISVKVTMATKQERDRLAVALKKLLMEDPSFTFHFDEETKEAIISGMGELHLEIILDRLRTEFCVAAEAGVPSIAYRETITREATADTRFVKQTGGKGQFAHCVMRLEPREGGGFEFVDHVKGGVIPREYIPAVRRGCEDALAEGAHGGFPVVGVRCVLLDGSYHEVDSSEMAFRTVGSLSFREAFRKAAPVLLEPMMKIEINSPDEYLGDLLSDLSRRRAKVGGMRRFRKGSQKINGLVPLREMSGYATVLRSLSSGRASFSMEFFQYMPLPANLEAQVLKDRKKQ
jgi:elongation factor G